MNRKAFHVIDLGFGDSGKGTIVDFLARRLESDLVIRFNGGPQAGHHVVLPDGRNHTFSQFGSGAFIAGVRTLLSQFMLIEPYALFNETDHLKSLGLLNPLANLFIDERCLVITPLHQVTNRIRERSRGRNAHGTCGMGVGECVQDSLDNPECSIFAADLSNGNTIRTKLLRLLDLKRHQLNDLLPHASEEQLRVLNDPNWIETAIIIYGQLHGSANIIPASRANQLIKDSDYPIFEAAQGILLDERYGFHPHTTWSKTTPTNSTQLLTDAGWSDDQEIIGVMRSYMTRHGAGPFPNFGPDLQSILPETNNVDTGYQGTFRRGTLDLVLLRYAIACCGQLDTLAVTHVDRLPLLPPVACDGYRIGDQEIHSINFSETVTLDQMQTIGNQLHQAQPILRDWPTGEENFITKISEILSCPVRYLSNGPTHLDKRVLPD